MGPYELSFFNGRINAEFDAMAAVFIENMTRKPQPLVYFSAYVNSTCCEFPKNWANYASTKSLDGIRPNDILVYVVSDDNSYTNTVTAAYDQTNQSIFSAQLSIGRTLFVCVILITITLLFTRDVEIEAL